LGTLRPIDSASRLPEAERCELDLPQTETSPPNGDKGSSRRKIANLETNLLPRVVKMHRMVSQNSPWTSIPEDVDGNGGKRLQTGRASSGSKYGSEGSANPGHKRPRGVTLLPGSDGEDGDGNLKKPDGRKPRGKGPRKPQEFGCPFFKHDPHKYGGRGGCREYSHDRVSILLRVSHNSPLI
jgi:hypothetical protein